MSCGPGTYGFEQLKRNEYHIKVNAGSYCFFESGIGVFYINPFSFSQYPFDNVIDPKFVPPRLPPILIGNDVRIGTGARLKAGITIGDGAFIAPYSIVFKDVPPYHYVYGNPAQTINIYTEEVSQRLQEIAWWNWPIERIEQIPKGITAGEFIEWYSTSN